MACKCVEKRGYYTYASSLREVCFEKRKFKKNLRNTVSSLPLVNRAVSRWRSLPRSNCILSMDVQEKSRSPLYESSKHKRVPIYVMMPLDSFCVDTTGTPRIRKIKALTISLKALKLAGVHGIAVEVWWGIVEDSSPFAYNWALYEELFKLISETGLKLQVALCFHSNMRLSSRGLGVNLPQWIMEIGQLNKDIYYRDRNGYSSDDYLTLGVDHHPLFCGRTALQCYEDFMISFMNKFEPLLGIFTHERFAIRIEDLKVAAWEEGKPHWGNKGPEDAGSYNSLPFGVPFFGEGQENFLSDYGHFFLEWYSDRLIGHADAILAMAANMLAKYQQDKQNPVLLVAKTASHPAELTAGYYNTAVRDGYDPLASMLSRHGAALQISCFEMLDDETPPSYLCSPEGLLEQYCRIGFHLFHQRYLVLHDGYEF
ncbi:hypothetical protein RJ639_012820 [Escallonia herrerae]|uniref:Beta-amylase n=1 Tax=Escallonia herrerae TaxID=1293975 RepID=A0AA89AS13_9ASTE|nr:hypothetical protein RJ639_012820 [Escallonia herrerae]